MKTKAILIHALSPVHAGTGQSVDVIDLPIARQRATGAPYIPGSSIKGVLRHTHSEDEHAEAIFGPPTERASDHAGALVVGDAHLLALPVRSFKGTFCWVTSPMLLTRASRDIEGAPGVPKMKREQRAALLGNDEFVVHSGKLYLEDLDLPASYRDANATAWAKFLAGHVWSEDTEAFTGRFAIVDDETMTFLYETATQIDTRVRIDPETRTVAKGALWIEESLPAETLLLALAGSDDAFVGDLSASDVLGHVFGEGLTITLGGKSTVGRGRCRLIALEGGRS